MVGNDSKIYIVRVILLCTDYDCVRLDEEYCFKTYEKAHDFIKKLIDPETSEKDLVLFRIELLEWPIDNENPCDKIKRWVYSMTGEVLESPNAVGINNETNIFNHLFCIGDIVFIRPSLFAPSSPSIEGDYGVIAEVPVSLHEWIRKGGCESKWDSAYLVYYITDTGIVDHKHICENALLKIENQLPEELIFLKYFSKHLKGEIRIPKEIVTEILSEIVYVKNTKVLRYTDDGKRMCFRTKYLREIT